jgi:DNA processing protein
LRCRLLAELAGPLDRCARNPQRLLEVLALDTDGLLGALAGRRRAELQAACHPLAREPFAAGAGALCVHDPDYPARLRPPRGPWLLLSAAPLQLLLALARGDIVAIAGATHASDYGAEVARALARGLAVSGVTVATTLERGIAAAARLGAEEVRGARIAVSCDGLGVASPAPHGPTPACVIAELPCGAGGRSFGALAAQRTLAALASVVVVVESACSPRALLVANRARSLGGTVAAVPGPVTSPASAGPHALLGAGATLVRGAEDVLELLAGVGQQRAGAPWHTSASLPAPLAGTLERVAGGADTAARLCAGAVRPDEVLLALSELELLGLLGRGRGGRYVARAGPVGAPCDSSI